MNTSNTHISIILRINTTHSATHRKQPLGVPPRDGSQRTLLQNARTTTTHGDNDNDHNAKTTGSHKHPSDNMKPSKHHANNMKPQASCKQHKASSIMQTTTTATKADSKTSTITTLDTSL
jgi:hypothetical protein